MSRDERGLLLGIDLGTSTLKAAIYDADLRLVQHSSIDSRSLTGASTGQLDAEQLWRVFREQLRALARDVQSERIAGIGITGMAESGCLIDADGRPLSRMLLWHDRRGMRQAAALRRIAGDDFAETTGLQMTSVRSIAKWMWMVEHGAPRHARWCGVPEWISLCLTGNWVTDATLAARTGVLDVMEGDYSSHLLDRAGAHAGLFPPVRGTPALAGSVLPAVAHDLGLPENAKVVVAGHDDIVAAYGAGGTAGDLIDSAGTAEGLIRIVDTAPVPSETVRARTAVTRYFTTGTWALISGAGSTGALMQLAANQLGLEPAALDELASPPGDYPDRVIDVRLSKSSLPVIQIRRGASAPNVWSAVLDLVCDRVQQAAGRLQGLAGSPTRLILIGGAAGSRELTKRKAARLGLPVLAFSELDATTRGAAALAASVGDRQSHQPAPS